MEASVFAELVDDFNADAEGRIRALNCWVEKIGQPAVLVDGTRGLPLSLVVDYSLVLNLMLEIGIEDYAKCQHPYCLAKKDIGSVVSSVRQPDFHGVAGTLDSWLHSSMGHVRFNRAVHEVLLSREGLVSRLGMLLGDFIRCQPSERDLPKKVEWVVRRAFLQRVWSEFLVAPTSPWCRTAKNGR